MAYTKQTWTDRKVEKPLTFLMTTNADGSITLTPYPGVVEQEGSQLSASRFNHIEDGIANSVNKAGDTMTGRLNITNKNEFVGVSKTRTVNGIDYTAALGVGADASASLELYDDSGTLGRIDINKDGKVKNFKTGKYLMEENIKTGSVTNPDASLFNITRSHIKQINNVVFVDLQIKLLEEIAANKQYSFKLSGVDAPASFLFSMAGYGNAEWKLSEPIYCAIDTSGGIFFCNNNAVSVKNGFWYVHLSYSTV